MTLIKNALLLVMFAINFDFGKSKGLGYYMEDVPTNHDFSYHVYDPYRQLNFGHSEVRDSHRAEGKYFALLPDGRMQTVTYIADASGYHPVISYERPSLFLSSELNPIRSSLPEPHGHTPNPLHLEDDVTNEIKLVASSSDYETVSRTPAGPTPTNTYQLPSIYNNQNTATQTSVLNSNEQFSFTSKEFDSKPQNFYNGGHHSTRLQKQNQNGLNGISSYTNSNQNKLTRSKSKIISGNLGSEESNEYNSLEHQNRYSNKYKVNEIGTPKMSIGWTNYKNNFQGQVFPDNNYENKNQNPGFQISDYKDTFSSHPLPNIGNQFNKVHEDITSHEIILPINNHGNNENKFSSYVSIESTPSQISPPFQIAPPSQIAPPFQSQTSQQTPSFGTFPENVSQDVSEEEINIFNPNTFGQSFAGGNSIFYKNSGESPAFSFSFMSSTPSLESQKRVMSSQQTSFNEKNDFKEDQTDFDVGKVADGPLHSIPDHQNSNFVFINQPRLRVPNLLRNTDSDSNFHSADNVAHAHPKNNNFVFTNQANLNNPNFLKNTNTQFNLAQTTSLPPNIRQSLDSNEKKNNFVFMIQPNLQNPRELSNNDYSLNSPQKVNSIADISKSSYTSHISYSGNDLSGTIKTNFGFPTSNLLAPQITPSTDIPTISTYTDIGPVFQPQQLHTSSSSEDINENPNFGDITTNSIKISTTDPQAEHRVSFLPESLISNNVPNSKSDQSFNSNHHSTINDKKFQTTRSQEVAEPLNNVGQNKQFFIDNINPPVNTRHVLKLPNLLDPRFTKQQRSKVTNSNQAPVTQNQITIANSEGFTSEHNERSRTIPQRHDKGSRINLNQDLQPPKLTQSNQFHITRSQNSNITPSSHKDRIDIPNKGQDKGLQHPFHDSRISEFREPKEISLISSLGNQANPSPFLSGNQESPYLFKSGSQDSPNPLKPGNQDRPNLFKSGNQDSPNPLKSGNQANPSPFLSGNQESPNLFKSGSQANSKPFKSENQDGENEFKSGNQASPNPFLSGNPESLNLLKSGNQGSPNPFKSRNQNSPNPFKSGNQANQNSFKSGNQVNQTPLKSGDETNLNLFKSGNQDSINEFKSGNQVTQNQFKSGNQDSTNEFKSRNQDSTNLLQSGNQDSPNLFKSGNQDSTNPLKPGNQDRPNLFKSGNQDSSNPLKSGNQDSPNMFKLGNQDSPNPLKSGNLDSPNLFESGNQASSNPFKFDLPLRVEHNFNQHVQPLRSGGDSADNIDLNASVVPRLVPVIIPIEDERSSKSSSAVNYEYEYGQSVDYLDDEYL